MRILVVSPGPNWSVEDVRAGWVKGLRQNGAEVGTVNLGAAIDFYHDLSFYNERYDCQIRPYDDVDAVLLAVDTIFAEAFKGDPDVVLIVSGFFIPQLVLPLLRERGKKVVYLFTESPYQDDQQIAASAFADLTIVNDPTNLAKFDRAYYQPHCYDPDLHFPGKGEPVWDFSFIGTGYDSRAEFFESVEWGDLNVKFGGNWPTVKEDSPLFPFFDADPQFCIDNDKTADIYRSSKLSANMYRREANRPDLAAGWSMGPREVELAACETFYLRDPRPESDEVFGGILPTFSSAGEFGELAQWWAGHDDARVRAAHQASSRIRERTFENAAARLLSTLNK
jgi:hypothetical protein